MATAKKPAPEPEFQPIHVEPPVIDGWQPIGLDFTPQSAETITESPAGEEKEK